jgi:hypothetical protein
MNAELTQKLLKRFPVLYQDYDSPMNCQIPLGIPYPQISQN